MSVNNSIVQQQEEKGVIKFDVDGQEVKLSASIVRKNLVNGNGNVTDQEINYFLGLCRARKLNPFVKEVYLIKYGNNSPATMAVAKDVLERRAIKNPLYKGKKVGIFVIDKNGELVKREHTILLDIDKLVGAWCEVYRKDWEFPAVAEVNFNEYVGKKNDGSANSMWAGKPVTMITKVAKAQALREAFIEELGGMFEAEELESSNPEISEIIPKNDIPQDIQEAMKETAEILETKKEEIEEANIL